MEGVSLLFLLADGSEPAHIHVAKDGKEVKIWLNDASVAINMGFAAVELSEIVRTEREERLSFMEAWNDHFAD